MGMEILSLTLIQRRISYFPFATERLLRLIFRSAGKLLGTTSFSSQYFAILWTPELSEKAMTVRK